MQRREFLLHSGLTISSAVLAQMREVPALAAQQPLDFRNANGEIDWSRVKAEFIIDPNIVQLAGFALAPHPADVRRAITKHRDALDLNPFTYLQEQLGKAEGAVLAAAAQYLRVNAADIALTDSTTMGLGLLYGGLKLREGQEILTTTHDHPATSSSLEYRARRTGCKVNRIALYQDSLHTSVNEIVGNITKALTPATRILAITWVHSSTGVCLPIREIAAALQAANSRREEQDRVLLCVDGVHGLGVKDATPVGMGCDFFVAGTHKWMFGPRGTGLVWGRSDLWKVTQPIITAYSNHTFTPGGYHSFEHRWSLNEAFRFHQRIGRANVAQRIAKLSSHVKEELAKMKHVMLRTPMSEDLSAGIVSFDVANRQPQDVVDLLRQRGICASVYDHVRYAPGLLTLEKDIDRALRELAALA